MSDKKKDLWKCDMPKIYLPECCPHWRNGSKCTFTGVCSYRGASANTTPADRAEGEMSEKQINPQSDQPTTIGDDLILSLWRPVRPSEKQTDAMTHVSGPYDLTFPSFELRRLVELAIEHGRNTATPAKPINTSAKLKVNRLWKEYPIGTRAYSCNGGWLEKVEQGWKPNGSKDVFPSPGGDAVGECLELPKIKHVVNTTAGREEGER